MARTVKRYVIPGLVLIGQKCVADRGGRMKVEFAPLNIPLRRRLQTAAVVQWVFSFLLVKTVDLDPSHNYLFGFHPHGVLVAGGFGNFCTEASGFSKLFPGLTPYLLMLPFWFRVPFFREYIMCGGESAHRLAGEAGLNSPLKEQLFRHNLLNIQRSRFSALDLSLRSEFREFRSRRHPSHLRLRLSLVSSEKASASYLLSQPGGGNVGPWWRWAELRSLWRRGLER
ncbi:hypothetical protein AOLI_G00152740 [Acnodon oligacanthus]